MTLIAGIDEAGRGPLAGPVVAAAVILPEGYSNPLVKDSKQLSARDREQLYEEIKNNALHYSIVAVGHKRIDSLNIREATKLAMKLASERVPATALRIDGNMEIPTRLPQEAIVKGDTKFIEISAASILAKVYRDRIMQTLDERYPGYGFKKHQGYPTKSHKASILTLGPCYVHRKTFRGVKDI